MGRIWDIIPPPPRPAQSSNRRRKSPQTSSVLFFIFILIILGVIFYGSAQKPNLKINGQSTSNPVSPSPSPSIEAKIPSGTRPLIKLINGSGQVEQEDKVKKILTEAGFKIAKSENALNLYDKTIIYYDISQEKNAQEIAEALKKYQTYLQKLSQDSSYDIIIVIGPQ